MEFELEDSQSLRILFIRAYKGITKKRNKVNNWEYERNSGKESGLHVDIWDNVSWLQGEQTYVPTSIQVDP